MKILNSLLGEDNKDQFFEKCFTRLPFSKPHGALAYLDLLNWKMVEEILSAGKSVLRIVDNGRVIKDYVALSFPEALAHHHQGHTLLIRFAERSSAALKAVAEDFSKSFHTSVDIQLYCTPKGHNAFGWHYDVEEVFIIQTLGSKSYTIRPNTVHPNPLVSSIPADQGYEKEQSTLEIKVTLEQGDWLYIPSGWWHVAQTNSESMHLSIGLMPSSAIDLATYLPGYLSQQPFWRSRMPIHLSFSCLEDEIDFYQDAMKKLSSDLAKTISSREFIKNFLNSKKSKLPYETGVKNPDS